MSEEGLATVYRAVKDNVLERILTFHIADAKEQFLESVLRVITPVVGNGDEVAYLTEEVETLARDAISLFATLLRCDEQHNLLAATSEEYPYQTAEEELAELFGRFLIICERLCQLVEMFQGRGYGIRSQSPLETVCVHARRLVRNDDETFYQTETYRALAERALVEYQTGWVEEWPV